MVPVQSVKDLQTKRCLPCEGGVAKYSLAEAQAQLQSLSQWQLSPDGRKIRKEWQVRNFMAGIDFFRRIAKVAEAENHHPDLHLESYRRVAVVIWTHAIDGLSLNDFILAAKIDALPIETKA
jgi:4a-hydroxytetrahydrobiopterin dehydratase